MGQKTLAYIALIIVALILTGALVINCTDGPSRSAIPSYEQTL